MKVRSTSLILGLSLLFGNAWADSASKLNTRKPSAASLSKEEIAALPQVQAGLICADETTPTFAMTGLNSLLSNHAGGSYIGLLEETSQKLGRVVNGKVIGHSITSYPSNASAIQVRFFACALISGN